MSKAKPQQKEQQLDWNHFQEHLKAHIPWVVSNLQLNDNKYWVSMNPKTNVSIEDIKKWKDEKLLYMIYENNKLYSILLRPQFPENDFIEEETKLVPIQYRKDVVGKDGEKITITKDNPPGLRNILKRNEPSKITDKKKEGDPNKKQETEQSDGIKIVNSFVFINNPELKNKFNAQYAIFERENK